MARWLARRERQGWSWTELSERSGHPTWKLRWWQKRFERTGGSGHARSGSFAAVEVTAAAPNPGGSIEITTPSGYRVQVGPDVDTEHLRRVMQALERGC